MSNIVSIFAASKQEKEMTAIQIINFSFEIYRYYIYDNKESTLVLREEAKDEISVFKEYVREHIIRMSNSNRAELCFRLMIGLNEMKRQEQETSASKKNCFLPMYEVFHTMFKAINDAVEKEVNNGKI